MAGEIAIRKQEAIERLRASLESVLTIRSKWLDDKKSELTRAIEAHKALAGIGASETKQRYSRNRVSMLRKVVNALEAGFVPIPRFSADTLNVDFEDMPLAALAAVNDAQATQLFDEIRLVRGIDPPQTRRRGRHTQRDPLLVGIVRMPGVTLTRDDGWPRQRDLPARETHFLLAWWAPEDETDDDLW